MENYQLFKTTIQLSEGTIQQRFVGRCTREQKLIIEIGEKSNFPIANVLIHCVSLWAKDPKKM